MNTGWTCEPHLLQFIEIWPFCSSLKKNAVTLFGMIIWFMIHLCDRILDNLPLVVPIRRPDQENAIVYQQGFHVGLRGQYAGVSIHCWFQNLKFETFWLWYHNWTIIKPRSINIIGEYFYWTLGYISIWYMKSSMISLWYGIISNFNFDMQNICEIVKLVPNSVFSYNLGA